MIQTPSDATHRSANRSTNAEPKRGATNPNLVWWWGRPRSLNGPNTPRQHHSNPIRFEELLELITLHYTKNCITSHHITSHHITSHHIALHYRGCSSSSRPRCSCSASASPSSPASAPSGAAACCTTAPTSAAPPTRRCAARRRARRRSAGAAAAVPRASRASSRRARITWSTCEEVAARAEEEDTEEATTENKKRNRGGRARRHCRMRTRVAARVTKRRRAERGVEASSPEHARHAGIAITIVGGAGWLGGACE